MIGDRLWQIADGTSSELRVRSSEKIVWSDEL